MAVRWDGKPATSNSSGPSSNNLASKFASRLQEARELGSTTYDIRQAAYSEQDDEVARTNRAHCGNDQQSVGMDHSNFGQVGWSPAQMSASGRTEGSASDNLTLAFPPLPQALQSYGQAPLYQQMQSRDIMSNPMDVNGVDNPAAVSSGAAQVGDEPPPPVGQDVDDIYAYLNGTFLPAQRISIYSQ